MRRPVLWAAVFLALGILLGQFGDMRTVLLFMFLSSLLCVCLFLKYRYFPLFLFLLFAAAGAIRIKPGMTDATGGESFRLEGYGGVVVENGLTGSGNHKLTVKLNEDFIIERTEVLENKKLTGKVKRLMIYTPREVTLGASVKISGLIEPLEHPAFPWNYDEFTYLRSRGIDAKMFLAAEDIEVLREEKPEIFTRFLILLSQMRDRLADVYDAALPPREAGIMKSILLGDKTELEDSDVELYRASGIYHLLCISGLHVGIFVLVVGKIFKIFFRERFALMLSLFVLVLYTMLTGASISTVRAAVMGGVFVFSKILFRDYDLLASTSVSCIVLLIYEPLYLYDAGFQLSFAAVFGIALLTPSVERLLTLALKGFSLKNTLASGIAATLATLPFLMFHFYEISSYGIIVNLFVIPTASLLVGAGLAVGVAGLVFFPAAVFLAGISYYLLKFYDSVCGFFANLPFAVIHTGHVGLPACIAFFISLAGFAYAFSDFSSRMKMKLLIFWGGLLSFGVCFFLQTYPFTLKAVEIEAGTVLLYRNRIYVAESPENKNRSGAEAELEDCLSYLGATDAVRVAKGEETEDGTLRIFNGDKVYVERLSN